MKILRSALRVALRRIFLILACLVFLAFCADLIFPDHAMLFSTGFWFFVFLFLLAAAYPGQSMGLDYYSSVLLIVASLVLIDFAIGRILRPRPSNISP